MVKHRAQGGFLALEADEADARVRDELQNGIQHSQSGAQDGHEDNFAFQPESARGFERGPDLERLDAEGARRLVALAEHREKIGKVVAFAVFDQIGLAAAVGNFFGAVNGGVEIAQLVHQAELQCLRA